MEYCILSKVFIDELETVVNFYIQNGWTPLGGVSYGRDGLYQAMTRPLITRWTVTTTPLNAEPNVISLNETVKVDFR